MSSMLKQLQSLSTIVPAFASLSTLIMLIRSTMNQMIPDSIQKFFSSKFSNLISSRFSSDSTFVIEERWQAVKNETFRAIEAYLPTRIDPTTKSMLLGSNDANNTTAPPKPGIPVNGEVLDTFEGMRLTWTLHVKESKRYHADRKYFHLTCSTRQRERVMQCYFPHICSSAQSILNKRDTLNVYTYDVEDALWESTLFKHPSTFDTLAIDPDIKQSIIEDLDLFVNRKDFFENVGRAWKRGYLLYGPPGNGKSSLVAAIANYLRYNIYDLQLQTARNDANLRNILTSTTNQSIVLIEDIDCSANLSLPRGQIQEPEKDDDKQSVRVDPGATLSGLLNFIDGLWSSCGDQRIVIFTTNHKDKLDPALLHPGRMDVHIYLGYCTAAGFKKLAATYLGIKHHSLFECIEDLIQRIEVTPAEVAEQLMKSSNPEVALQNLIEVLNTKEIESEEAGAEQEKKGVITDEVVEFKGVEKQEMNIGES